jgi:hypothetical protein
MQNPVLKYKNVHLLKYCQHHKKFSRALRNSFVLFEADFYSKKLGKGKKTG